MTGVFEPPGVYIVLPLAAVGWTAFVLEATRRLLWLPVRQEIRDAALQRGREADSNQFIVALAAFTMEMHVRDLETQFDVSDAYSRGVEFLAGDREEE